MTQYIDKSALVAEIERRISVLKANESNESVISMLANGMFVNEFKDLLSFLDTLEVKDVNLEEEIDKFIDSKEVWEIQEAPVSTIEDAAKYFFELGLKA